MMSAVDVSSIDGKFGTFKLIAPVVVQIEPATPIWRAGNSSHERFITLLITVTLRVYAILFFERGHILLPRYNNLVLLS